MSVNHYLYYGIYLVGEGMREIEVDGALACPEGHHNSWGHDSKFCATCGAVLAHQKEMDPVSFSDFEQEESNEFIKKHYGPLKDIRKLSSSFYRMYTDGVRDDIDILVPTNKRIFGVHFTDEETAEELPYPYKKVMSPTEARKVLSEEIKMLRKYLYKKVTVTFGSISSWG